MQNNIICNPKKIVSEWDFQLHNTHLYHIPRIILSFWFKQSYKFRNIQVKLSTAYKFMLMTLSIIQPSPTLNHACKSKTIPVAPYTYINLCVCPGGSWICFEVSLSEVSLNLYRRQSLNLSCRQRWPCPEDFKPQNCPYAPLPPATSPVRPYCGDLREGRGCVGLFVPY